MTFVNIYAKSDGTHEAEECLSIKEAVECREGHDNYCATLSPYFVVVEQKLPRLYVNVYTDGTISSVCYSIDDLIEHAVEETIGSAHEYEYTLTDRTVEDFSADIHSVIEALQGESSNERGLKGWHERRLL